MKTVVKVLMYIAILFGLAALAVVAEDIVVHFTHSGAWGATARWILIIVFALGAAYLFMDALDRESKP